jgi:DNA-binding NtrC family response regulator
MTGIQLLAESKRLQPEATRVLLTGHADKASAIKAINEVGLFQYLEKPWDNEQLLLVIQQGVERAQLLGELRQKISELDTAHSTLKNTQARLLKAFL